jgi:hypothetical protein
MIQKIIYVFLFILLLCSLANAQPSSWDWRNVGGINYVTSVKDQQSCNACVAYAGTAALESWLVRNGILSRDAADLSEQVLISCPSPKIMTCASGGGTSMSVASYLYNYGVPLESCFAETHTDTTCSGNACSIYRSSGYKIVDYGSVSSISVANIKSAIYNYGPVLCDMQEYLDFWTFTGSGVYHYDGSSSKVGGHTVLVVGYDDTGQYFIIKNSWGTGWGDSGFGKVGYDQVGDGKVNFGNGTIYYTGAYAYNNSLSTCGSSPTTYYVDYVGGNNSNNGRSTSTPWKTAPGGTGSGSRPIPNCTLQPGDKVIFKGGVTYQDTIDVGFPYLPSGAGVVVKINASGTGDADNQRIIYDGDSGTYVSRWGSGSDKAIIDGQGTQYRGFYFNGARSYITINGFKIQNFNITSNYYAAPTDENYGGLIFGVGNGTAGAFQQSNYVTISYNDFLHIGDYAPPYRDAGGGDAGYMRTGVGIFTRGGDYWKIHHNTFTDCGGGAIGLVDVNHDETYNNTVTGTNSWPVYMVFNPGTWTDHKYHDNIQYNTNLLYIPTRGVHADCFYIFTPYVNGHTVANVTNFYFFNNYFYNTTYPRATGGATGFVYIESNSTGTFDGFYLFNNVFFNPENVHTIIIDNRCPPSGPCDSPYSTMKNFYILNNTTVIPGDQIGIALVNYVCNSSNFYNFWIRNNIIYKLQQGHSNSVMITMPQVANVGSTFQFDHNSYNDIYTGAYFTQDSSVNGSVCGGTVVGNYFAGWQNVRVGSDPYFDRDGSNHGQVTSSYFVNTTPGSQNLHLTSSATGVIGQGANLTSYCSTIPALCNDKDGKPRPASGNWDMGSYQFTVVPPGEIPSPPRNLKIVQ